MAFIGPQDVPSNSEALDHNNPYDQKNDFDKRSLPNDDQDPFGDEGNAVVKYKVMKWWSVLDLYGFSGPS